MRFRKHSLASAFAIAVSLSACDAGTSVAIAPLPSPPPTPAPPSIEAAAQAALPAASAYPQAEASGPTIDNHVNTDFPLIESAVTINLSGLVAEQHSTGDLAFEATGDPADSYTLNVPDLGISTVHFAAGGYYCYSSKCGDTGSSSVDLNMADPATTNLSWTTYGFWTSRSYAASGPLTTAAFVTGYRTPVGSMPTVGTATYTGAAQGRLMAARDYGYLGVGIDSLSGDATLLADFGSGTLSGSLTNMVGPGGAWNNVSLVGAITSGDFTGTAAVTSSPGTFGSMSGSATGTFAGSFFGPSAQELGAVWTLHDGTSTAVGTIGASHGP